MYETHKYGSKLYNPEKPFYKMTIQELCDHGKICKSLDKTSIKDRLITPLLGITALISISILAFYIPIPEE